MNLRKYLFATALLAAAFVPGLRGDPYAVSFYTGWARHFDTVAFEYVPGVGLVNRGVPNGNVDSVSGGFTVNGTDVGQTVDVELTFRVDLISSYDTSNTWLAFVHNAAEAEAFAIKSANFAGVNGGSISTAARVGPLGQSNYQTQDVSGPLLETTSAYLTYILPGTVGSNSAFTLSVSGFHDIDPNAIDFSVVDPNAPAVFGLYYSAWMQLTSARVVTDGGSSLTLFFVGLLGLAGVNIFRRRMA